MVEEVSAESAFLNMEAYLKYREHEPVHILIENYMLSSTVRQVKAGLVALAILKRVWEHPDDLLLCMVLPPLKPLEPPRRLTMEDSQRLDSYMQHFAEATMFELVPR